MMLNRTNMGFVFFNLSRFVIVEPPLLCVIFRPQVGIALRLDANVGLACMLLNVGIFSGLISSSVTYI